MRVRSGEVVAMVAFDEIPRDFTRAELRLEALRPPLASFEMRIFADEPKAGATTTTLDNPRYLGSQFFFGLGSVGEAQPQNVYRIERDSQSAPTSLRLNITTGLRRYLESVTPHRAPVSLVTVDRAGNAGDDFVLDFEGVSIVTT